MNNVALGGIQDLLFLSIASEVFPILEIFKMFYFLPFDKTFSVEVLVLNNLDYKAFCKMIRSWNYPGKLWG